MFHTALQRLKTLPALVLMAASLSLSAGDLPPAVQAKFVKILAAAAGSPGKVVCKDGDVLGELEKIGVSQDSGSKVAWATGGDVKSMKAAGKFVICSKLDDLPKGGAIAIVEEGGKPQIYLHMGNIAASGVSLADSVLKIGKRL
ncbi:hypothetical protein [Geothrix sp. PMB-07]|uniref:hypothetical protein n=1 Tax=Geothrix sp. PMB-07 TaxID=3068640 RepID=UPI0027429782|nr:hypothetical protein [Geothrix sp. PMB-07]WLT31391.1 hypothetical protein Q9293_16905 [Geothrix sp. PMB-07]